MDQAFFKQPEERNDFGANGKGQHKRDSSKEGKSYADTSTQTRLLKHD